MTARSDDPTEGGSLADRLRAWGPAVAWACVLYFLSALPNLRAAPSLPFGDKVAHTVLYSVLGGALAWGWARSSRSVPHVVLVAVGALYGLSDEWHQMYVPGRMPDVADWMADVVGLLIGYGLVLWWWARTNVNEEVEEVV